MSKGKDYKIEVLMKTVKNKEAIEASLRPVLQSATAIARKHPDITEKVNQTISKYLDNIIPSTIRNLIDSYFSEKDLDDCIQFFTSEAGKKILNPDYQQKNQNALIDVSKEMQKEILDIIRPFMPLANPTPQNPTDAISNEL